MRVAVTCEIEYSMFSNGNTNTSIAVAELLSGLGHDVVLLDLVGQQEWWDDCKPLQKLFKVVQAKSLGAATPAPFDLLVEIGRATVPSAFRAAQAARAVWVVRKPFAVTEIEATLFPVRIPGRDLTGLSEVWLLNDVTMPDDIYSLEVLARCPVRHLPFVWSPMPAESHLRSIGAPAVRDTLDGPADIRMVDSNASSTSSSTIPLVAMREAARQGLDIGAWRVHNGEHLLQSKFFRENILKHCTDLSGQTGTFVGRQRVVEWIQNPAIVAMLHLRFQRLRPVLLDLAWAGVPVVHNSPILKEIPTCGRSYYTDNSIEEAVAALAATLEDARAGTGWFTAEAAAARRTALLHLWSPASAHVRSHWTAAVGSVGAAAATAAAVPAAAPVQPPAITKRTLRIAFSDMYDDFQADTNLFIAALNAAGKTLSPPRTFVGFDAAKHPNEPPPDLLIFGPFGNAWRSLWPTTPKVHVTGENTPPVEEPGVVLNLGFQHKEAPDYLRLPLWLFYINWFGLDEDKCVNPRPMPLALAARSWAGQPARDKFAAFVVSNPTNKMRNQAFHAINAYKPVDSAGQLFNTVGYELAAGRGGGGGERKKVRFLQSYRFSIAYENSASPGYTTEKYLHAKAAGCVPIYWGDPEFERDFDLSGCIDARGFTAPEQLVAAVQAVDSDPAEWAARAAVPALSAERVEAARARLADLVRTLFLAMKVEGAVPSHLGATPESPIARHGLEAWTQACAAPVACAATAPAASTSELPIPVTYASFKYLGCLQQWLKVLSSQSASIPNFRAIVFLAPDIRDETKAALQAKYPFATFERPPTDWTPTDFPDFWEPGHYAWKVWLYNELATRESLKGSLLLYTDAGSLLVRWPYDYCAIAAERGVCCLQDTTQTNDKRCSEKFCTILQVTDAERAANQICAGVMCFRSGDPGAVAYFKAAFELAQNRQLVEGPRVIGVSQGDTYGHRHDQSILSLLALRQSIPMFPFDKVYCDHSMRKTFESGAALYFHRGDFKLSVPFLPGIDDAFLINLDKRADRLERFKTNHPELKDRVTRVAAWDGRATQLTEDLANLFRPNDFFWKKSVMGCALSHLGLVWKLVNDHASIQNYLILEDDVKFKPGALAVLAQAMKHAPADYDVLYLGGILPPNRDAFQRVLEPVNEYFGKIRPNQIFGQKVPTPFFHSCTYAYILSRKGANKICEAIQRQGGYWTSADHIMDGPCEFLNLYFASPLLAGCYQDDDPAYASSDFNDFSRVDKFDSDLWNNDERFTAEEVGAFKQTPLQTAEEFRTVLNRVFKKGLSAASSASLNAQPAAPLNAQPLPTQQPPVAKTLDLSGAELPIRFVSVRAQNFSFTSPNAYERDWLFRLAGIQSADVDLVDESTPPPTDCPILILQRPHVAAATQLATRWSAAGASFKLLHLSDEFGRPEGRDDLTIYTLPGCKGVLRNYMRTDYPPGTESKVRVIPLGYHWSPGVQNPIEETPQSPFRETHWCFFGTNWCNREEAMKPLIDSKLTGAYRFTKEWNAPDAVPRDEYLSQMLNSSFVPCPGGMNQETFRVYEALECGCIPIVLKQDGNEAWVRWLQDELGIVVAKDWADAVRIMTTLVTKPETLEIYRRQVLQSWMQWIGRLQEEVQRWMKLRN